MHNTPGPRPDKERPDHHLEEYLTDQPHGGEPDADGPPQDHAEPTLPPQPGQQPDYPPAVLSDERAPAGEPELPDSPEAYLRALGSRAVGASEGHNPEKTAAPAQPPAEPPPPVAASPAQEFESFPVEEPRLDPPADTPKIGGAAVPAEPVLAEPVVPAPVETPPAATNPQPPPAAVADPGPAVQAEEGGPPDDSAHKKEPGSADQTAPAAPHNPAGPPQPPGPPSEPPAPGRPDDEPPPWHNLRAQLDRIDEIMLSALDGSARLEQIRWDIRRTPEGYDYSARIVHALRQTIDPLSLASTKALQSIPGDIMDRLGDQLMELGDTAATQIQAIHSIPPSRITDEERAEAVTKLQNSLHIKTPRSDLDRFYSAEQPELVNAFYPELDRPALSPAEINRQAPGLSAAQLTQPNQGTVRLPTYSNATADLAYRVNRELNTLAEIEEVLHDGLQCIERSGRANAITVHDLRVVTDMVWAMYGGLAMRAATVSRILNRTSPLSDN